MRQIWIVIAFLLSTSSILMAQSVSYKRGISVKKMFLDYQSQNGGTLGSFKDYQHGYEIGFHNKLTDKLGLHLPVRYGIVNSHLDSINCLKKRILSLDAQLNYTFNPNAARFLPYLVAGVGGVYEKEGDFNIQIPLGIGLNIRIAPNAFINWQSEYRYALKEDRNNLQHGLGFIYMFGKQENKMEELVIAKDSDNDGVPDDLDLCPNIFGDKALNGCPDSDGDGVPNYLDKCPDTKGQKAFEGCPDSDGDGVPDHLDQCPNVAGLQSNQGCPKLDKDGDGVNDSEDRCPDLAGPLDNHGCPYADTDGDGVPDKDDKCPNKFGIKIYNGCPDTDGDGIDDSRDKCPNTPGTVSNDGCPEIKSEDKKTLEIAMKAVQFQTGSAVLKSESFTVLNQIVDIMQRYPDFKMMISGHTDNVGSAELNQSLSEKRAKACYDYLSKHNISSYRLSYTGFGESRPISTNETEKGRSLNRRVEFNLIPGN